MTQYLGLLILTGFISIAGQPARATDISDDVMDLEEVTADSAAAKAEAREAAARVAKEQQENARELKSVREARQSAVLKKQEATDTLKRSETELQRLAGEKGQLNKDILRFGSETMANEKMIAEAKAKIEKVKAEIAALQAAKAAKQASTADLTKQKMELIRNAGAADDELALLQRDMQRADIEEKAAIAELEQARAEEVARKVASEAKIKELKGQIQATRLQRKSLDTEVRKFKNHNRRLDEQVKVGMSELNQ